LLDFCLADRLAFLVIAAIISDVCLMMRRRGNGIGCCRTWFLILRAANCHLEEEEEEFDLSIFGTGDEDQRLWFLVWLSITRNNGRETFKCCTKSNSTGAQYVTLQIKIGWREVKTYLLDSEEWFWPTFLHSLLRLVKGTAKQTPAGEECNKYALTAALCF
jgi:hypothetical protein